MVAERTTRSHAVSPQSEQSFAYDETEKRHSKGWLVFPYLIAIAATAVLLLATVSASFRADLWGKTTSVTVLATPKTGWAVGNCVAYADSAHDYAKAVVCSATHYGIIVARASSAAFCPNASLVNSSVLSGPKNSVFCVLSTVS